MRNSIAFQGKWKRQGLEEETELAGKCLTITHVAEVDVRVNLVGRVRGSWRILINQNRHHPFFSEFDYKIQSRNIMQQTKKNALNTISGVEVRECKSN